MSRSPVNFIFHKIVENKVSPIITGNFQASSSSAAGMYSGTNTIQKTTWSESAFVLVGIMIICDYSKDP
jgi:hypothetical protein